ncbi:piggyBac transposable element-derived protein 3-like [Diorhabda carinulata]|uniref:piggyBac transposable element-derived protein 3-like n=1 Tax=Diorhabda carinulata TaxID=1163345 RepID=UPI0025A2D9A9|nr:piggyBac transposable element-derived protein 3-like [Diorhabda carinulata]
MDDSSHGIVLLQIVSGLVLSPPISRHRLHEFIRGKPVRFGYKDWMLCSSDGFCYSFDTYCGAKPSSVQAPTKIKTSLPLGSRVVLVFAKIIDAPSDHVLFFDNYFASHDLLNALRKIGIRATGTVHDNRTKKCPLVPVKTIKKKRRPWNDNSAVTMATNYDSVEPLAQIKRWSSKRKEKMPVPQPQLFKNYNYRMGGVDLLDQGVNNYRIAIHG